MRKIRLSKTGYKYKSLKLYALVDDEDFESLNKHNWCASFKHNTWYAARKGSAGQSNILMHRQILKVKNPKIVVDHKNFNGLDNRRRNIRACSQSENTKNYRRIAKYTSRYLGVSWSKLHDKWKVQICANYKKKHIGLFTSQIEAAKAYDAAANKYFGEFANLNFKKSK